MKSFITLLIVLICPVILIAQTTGTISGVVVDESGDPLAGANIMVEGTSTGTATDFDGKFEITIPVGSYDIRVEFIGYKTKTVPRLNVLLNETNNVSIELEPSVLAGEAVVVIGYGVQKKRDLTGAATTVRMSEFQKMPTPSVATALQGKAPGVNIEFPSGAPYSAPVVKIRGIGTLGNNDPLYVIDGVPSEINFVDPGDIESIDILKDASAAAIYGSRAANGVIIITTKRGEKNSPLEINFRSYYGHQVIPDMLDVLNSQEYATHMINMFENAGEDVPSVLTDVKNNPNDFANTDWQDLIYKNAPMKKYELSVSGGGDWFNFAISGAYAKKEGITIRTGQERQSLRVNSDFTKGKIKIGESISLSRMEEDYVTETGWTSGYYTLFSSPLQPVYDKNLPGGYGMTDKSKGLPHSDQNPLALQETRDNEGYADHITASVYAEYEIIPNLTYKIQASQNIKNFNSYEFHRPYGYEGEEGYNWLSEVRYRQDHNIIENTLSYAYTFNKHNVNALAGFSQERTDWRSVSGRGEKLPADDLNILDVVQKDPATGGSSWSDRLRSMFARVNYSYADKYLAQFNVRRDGSSRFNKEDRYGTFPSASFGWRISEEPFFKSVPYFTDVKLRTSYGVLGNNQIQRYAYIPSIYINPGSSTYSYVFGSGQDVYIGAAIPELAAYRIKWETTKTLDYGLDFSMFEDKLEFSADYYIKKTEDMLLNVPLPRLTGVWEGPVTNIGEMENKGFELAVSYRNHDNEFKYDVTANLTTYNNKLVKLSGIESDAIMGGHLEYGSTNPVTKSISGEEVGAYWLYQTDGLFQSENEVNSYKNSKNELIQPLAAPGDIKFIDVNGDGKITDDDRTFMGSALPDFDLGMNFRASYKNFDCSMFIFGSFGRKLYNATSWQGERMSEWENQLSTVKDAWTPDNKDTDVPRAVFADPNGNSKPSDRFLEDGDYFRIRNLEIGYTLPQNLLTISGIKRCRFYVSIENLLTITDYSGYDPAVYGGYDSGLRRGRYGYDPQTESGTIFDRGIDTAALPMPKVFLSGVELSF